MNKKTIFVGILASLFLFLLVSEYIKIPVFVILLTASVILFFSITNKERKQVHAKVLEINETSRINPNQYLSKAGPVCAGSDTKYEIVFLLDDDTNISLSVSSKIALKIIKGTIGNLTYYDNVFVDFVPCN